MNFNIIYPEYIYIEVIAFQCTLQLKGKLFNPVVIVSTAETIVIYLLLQQPIWFHYSCFFKKNKPAQLSEIAGFDGLRWDDQEKIKQHFSGDASVSLSTVDEVDAQLSEFQVDYAKSNRSKCKRCEEKINKDDLRVANMVDGAMKQMSGKIPAWHHVDCFVEKKEEEPELAEITEHDIAGYFSCCKRCLNHFKGLICILRYLGF